MQFELDRRLNLCADVTWGQYHQALAGGFDPFTLAYNLIFDPRRMISKQPTGYRLVVL